jgi:hypothetical protein
MRDRFLPAAVLCAAALLGPAVPATAQAADTVYPPGDYNGDGWPDLAVGVPHAEVDGKRDAGYVHVLWGGPDGPGTLGSTRVTQATSGVPGTPEAGDLFGSAVASRDVDGDGVDDLVVGASSESLTEDVYAEHGTVTVITGPALGTAFTRGGHTVARGGNPYAKVGSVIAVGDVNGDHQADLALGHRAEESGGAVLRPGPLTAESPDTLSGEITGTHFGGVVALAVGDFDGDTYGDLAVSVSATESRSVEIHRWKDGVPVEVWNTQASAASLAAADFDADGVTDLALGSCYPNYEADEPDCADHSTGRAEVFEGGLVKVAYGSRSGGFGTRTQEIHQDTPGVPGTAEPEDTLGVAVAAGDVDHDGHADLAIGNPTEAAGSQRDAGMVTVLHGGDTGLLSADGTARGVGFTQASSGVPGTAESGDRFGTAVQLQDHGYDGAAELTAGAPGENSATGGVWYFPGAPQGPTATGSRSLTPNNLGLPSSSSALRYGLVVARR